MALETQCDTTQITFSTKGQAQARIIDDVQINATDALFFGVSMSLGTGSAVIKIFDAAGNETASVRGNPSTQASCRLVPAAIFADNTPAGSRLDMDLDEASYGAGSKIEIEFAGASGTTPSQIGVNLRAGTSQFLGQSSGQNVRGIEGNGVVTFTIPFQVITV